MAVAIRLRREGSKDRPIYRLVAVDSRTRRDGRFIESLGSYDPNSKKDPNFSVNVDRVDHWIGVGAKPSDTASNLIKKARKLPKPEAATEEA